MGTTSVKGRAAEQSKSTRPARDRDEGRKPSRQEPERSEGWTDLALGGVPTVRLCRGKGGSCGCPACGGGGSGNGGGGGGGDPGAAPGTVVDAAIRSGSGRPLTPGARAFFEPRFGRSLDQVRVHSDAKADASARSLGADAYALGSHLVFRSGRYQPETPSGRRLLAHELAHTFQEPEATPRRSAAYPVAGARSADEERADAAARAALAPDSEEDAWKLAVGGGETPAGPVVRARASDDGLLAGAREGAGRFVSWAGGTAGRARDTLQDTARGGAETIGSFVASGAESARGGVARLVERVSPLLADMVRRGPLTVLRERIELLVGPWMDSLRERFDPGALLAQAREWLGDLGAGGAGLVRWAGSCVGFARLTRALSDAARQIAEHPAVDRIRSVLTRAHGAVASLVGFMVETRIRNLRWLWEGVQAFGGVVRSAVQAVRSFSATAWDWVSERLGLGGEGGIAEWVTERAERVWTRLRTEVFPAALTSARRSARVLYELSGLGRAASLIRGARTLVAAASWLWEHRHAENLAETAAQDPAVRDTFLPRLLEAGEGLHGSMERAADWFRQRLGEASAAVLGLVEGVTGLPVGSVLRSVLERVAEGLEAARDWIGDALGSTAAWVGEAARSLWSAVRPILSVAALLAIGLTNPALFPVVAGAILGSFAWRALPDCYKPPLIDLLLDLAITAVRALPDLPLFGPLWSLFRPGVLGFLERLREASPEEKIQVTDRVAEILLWSGLDFVFGYVWGFLRGVWSSLTDIFVLLWTIGRGLARLAERMDDAGRRALGIGGAQARRVGSDTEVGAPGGEVEAGVPVADGARAVAPREAGAQTVAPADAAPDLGEELHALGQGLRPHAETVAQDVGPAAEEYFASRPGLTFEGLRERLGSLWGSAQEALEDRGERLAEEVIDRLMAPDAREMGADAAFSAGRAVGWLSGTIITEVVIFVLSAGIVTAGRAILRPIVWLARAIDRLSMAMFGPIIRAIGRVGGLAMSLFRSLNLTVTPAAGGALRRVVDALGSIGRALVRFVTAMLERVGFRATERLGASAAEGGARVLGRETAQAGEGAAGREVSERLGRQGTEAPTGRVGTLETGRMTPADRTAEFQWIERNQRRLEPSTEPGYVAQIRLPGDRHTWRMDSQGRWCRFSFRGTCFVYEGPQIRLPTPSRPVTATAEGVTVHPPTRAPEVVPRPAPRGPAAQRTVDVGALTRSQAEAVRIARETPSLARLDDGTVLWLHTKKLFEPAARRSLTRANDRTIQAINRFGGESGFERVMADWLAGGPNQEGARWVLHAGHDLFGRVPAGRIIFEGTMERGAGGQALRVADVMVQTRGGTLWEFKNVLEVRPGAVKQFKTDLVLAGYRHGLDAVPKLRWVFNSEKMARSGLPRDVLVEQLQRHVEEYFHMLPEPIVRRFRDAVPDIVVFHP